MKMLYAALIAALAVPTTTFTWNYAGRATDNGDFGPGSAYVNPDGDWGCTAHVSNHSIWCHEYKYRVRFKKGEAVFYSGETNSVRLCGHHAEAEVSGSGKRVDVLRDNFHEINSADLVLIE